MLNSTYNPTLRSAHEARLLTEFHCTSHCTTPEGWSGRPLWNLLLVVDPRAVVMGWWLHHQRAELMAWAALDADHVDATIAALDAVRSDEALDYSRTEALEAQLADLRRRRERLA
jgi:hypothetical protein